MTAGQLTRGIREKGRQFAHQLIQVMLVGFAIGMTRTVIPALAEETHPRLNPANPEAADA